MNYKNYAIGTLSQDSFVMVNKVLARRLGFVEAGLLAELIFTYKGAEQNNNFYDGGAKGEWFYLTQASVEERLGIKRREHDTAIKNLVKAEVIFKKQMGLPARSYYILNWKNIVEIYERNEAEPAPLSDCTKRTNKEVRNVQTRMDEPYKPESTKRTSIHINKKEVKERDIKNNYKNFVNKEGNPNEIENYFSKGEILETADSFYSEFAAGRWGKQAWFTITDKLATEICDRCIAIRNLQAYIHGALEVIAYKHDFKNGKVAFKYENENGKVPFYNWLEDWEDIE